MTSRGREARQGWGHHPAILTVPEGKYRRGICSYSFPFSNVFCNKISKCSKINALLGLETTAAILLLPYLFKEDPSGLYVRDMVCLCTIHLFLHKHRCACLYKTTAEHLLWSLLIVCVLIFSYFCWHRFHRSSLLYCTSAEIHFTMRVKSRWPLMGRTSTPSRTSPWDLGLCLGCIFYFPLNFPKMSEKHLCY